MDLFGLIISKLDIVIGLLDEKYSL